ncbi:MAG: poly(3-hydroxyalkanoate) depolymerase, partial [Paralcaligenes sp.]
SALSAMKKPVIRTLVQTGSGVPTMVFHGDRDAIVHPGNAQGVIEASACSAAPVETLRVSGMGNKRQCTKHLYRDSAGDIIAERWEIHGAGHAWAGGTESGSYTDQAGPDATAEMLRFFFNYTLSSKQ